MLVRFLAYIPNFESAAYFVHRLTRSSFFLEPFLYDPPKILYPCMHTKPYFQTTTPFLKPDFNIEAFGPEFGTRGNLAHARACGAGRPQTVEHRYLYDLGCYRTLVMRSME